MFELSIGRSLKGTVALLLALKTSVDTSSCQQPWISCSRVRSKVHYMAKVCGNYCEYYTSLQYHAYSFLYESKLLAEFIGGYHCADLSSVNYVFLSTTLSVCMCSLYNLFAFPKLLEDWKHTIRYKSLYTSPKL